MSLATGTLLDNRAPVAAYNRRFEPARMVWDWLSRRAALARSRAALRQLDDRLLADVALTRAAATIEAGRSFWG